MKNYIKAGLTLSLVAVASLSSEARSLICYKSSGTEHCFLSSSDVCPITSNSVEITVCANSYSINGSGVGLAVTSLFDRIKKQNQSEISQIFEQVNLLVKSIERFKEVSDSYEMKVLVSNNVLGVWKSGKLI